MKLASSKAWLLRHATLQVVKPEEPMAEDAQWVSERSQKGCILIYENDPPPGALLGHMAFGGFNPETERLQVDAIYNCILANL